MMPVHFTLLPSLYAQDVSRWVSMQWEEVIQKPIFTQHRITETKDSVPMFCAARFKTPTGRNETNAIDANLLIYDVDTFREGSSPESQMDYLRLLLRTRDIPALLITSYSHHPPTKYGYRLIIPMNQALAKKAWRRVLEYVRKDLYIPAHPDLCKGISHPYFLPSTNATNLPHATIECFKGEPIDVSQAVLASDADTPSAPESDAQLPATTAPVDLVKLRKHITTRAHSLFMRGYIERSNYLKRVLAGEPLTAEPKGRHLAMLQVTNDLVWAWPAEAMDQPFEVYEHLLKDSMERTLDYNEKEVAKLQNMVTGSWRKRKAYEEQKTIEAEKLNQLLAKEHANIKQPLPVKGVDF